MTSKFRVMAKHRTAASMRNPEGGWDIRTANNTLLGQGSTAGMAWWDAEKALMEAREQAKAAPTETRSWPFPVSGHNWSTA